MWQHIWGEVKYLMTTLLQISWRMWQWKNFENRPVFDEVMCRQRRLTFFGPPCILSAAETVGYGFWQYKSYADIRRRSLVRWCQMRVRALVENASFLLRSLYLPYEVPHWLYISKFTRLRAVSRRQHGSCYNSWENDVVCSWFLLSYLVSLQLTKSWMWLY